MAYFILLNLDETKYLYNPYSQEFAINNIELSLELGEAGALEFDIYKTHPYYDDIKPCETLVTVFKDELNRNGRIFDGQVREVQKNIDGSLNVYCVGELAYLLDTYQAQREFHGEPRIYLRDLLNYHNTQIGAAAADRYKYFQSGTISTDDDYIYRYANYQPTLEVIREDIVDSLGVYPKIVRVNDTINSYKQLQFYPIEEYGQTNPQTVEFGINLMDYVQNEASDELYTAVLPLGKKKADIERDGHDIDALDAYVTVREVNNGLLYIKNDEAVAQYGYRCALEQWEDIDIPATLLNTATEWLLTAQYKSLSLEIKAIDLSMMGANVNAFQIGDQVRCLATPLGIDVTLPLTAMKIYPQAPEKNIITLGASTPSLTRQTIQLKDERQDEKQTDLIDWVTDHGFQSLADWYGESGAVGPNLFGINASWRGVTMGKVNAEGPASVQVYSLGVGALPNFTSQFECEVTGYSGWNSSGVRFQNDYDVYNGNTATQTFGSATASGDFESTAITAARVFGDNAFSVRGTITGTAGKIGTMSTRALVSKKTLPWHTYNYYNGQYLDGLADCQRMTVSGGGWYYCLIMQGEIMVRGTLPWNDLNDKPSKLYAQFTIYREAIEALELVDENGTYLVDENGNNIGVPGADVADDDPILDIKFGTFTRTLTHAEISTSEQRLTIDMSEAELETGVGPSELNTYLQHITLFNHAPYKLYIYGFHLYGDADVYNGNPWTQLWGI